MPDRNHESISVICGECSFKDACKDRCIIFDQPLRETNHHPKVSVKCLPCIKEGKVS